MRPLCSAHHAFPPESGGLGPDLLDQEVELFVGGEVRVKRESRYSGIRETAGGEVWRQIGFAVTGDRADASPLVPTKREAFATVGRFPDCVARPM